MVALAGSTSVDYSLLYWVLAGGLVAGLKGMAAQSEDRLEKVLGQAVLDALNAVHLSVKESAALMKVDEGNLRSMLRGEGKYHLGLVHLARLPFSFWTVFGPVLFFLMAQQSLHEIREDLGLRRSA